MSTFKIGQHKLSWDDPQYEHPDEYIAEIMQASYGDYTCFECTQYESCVEKGLVENEDQQADECFDPNDWAIEEEMERRWR